MKEYERKNDITWRNNDRNDRAAWGVIGLLGLF